jgi:hypothetical protein
MELAGPGPSAKTRTAPKYDPKTGISGTSLWSQLAGDVDYSPDAALAHRPIGRGLRDSQWSGATLDAANEGAYRAAEPVPYV